LTSQTAAAVAREAHDWAPIPPSPPGLRILWLRQQRRLKHVCLELDRILPGQDLADYVIARSRPQAELSTVAGQRDAAQLPHR
jgi:hypothetical protein